MLSRTADNLYWLSRYTERADFVARILGATMRVAALPSSYVGEHNEWESAVASAGDLEEFRRLYDAANEQTVRDFLAFSPEQPVFDPQLHRDSRATTPARCAPPLPSKCGRRSTAPGWS